MSKEPNMSRNPASPGTQHVKEPGKSRTTHLQVASARRRVLCLLHRYGPPRPRGVRPLHDCQVPLGTGEPQGHEQADVREVASVVQLLPPERTAISAKACKVTSVASNYQAYLQARDVPGLPGIHPSLQFNKTLLE